jgi:hypothetical protein
MAERAAVAVAIEDGFTSGLDGLIYWRRYTLAKKGWRNTNHKHPKDHETEFEAAFRVFHEGEPPYDVVKGQKVDFPAHRLHQFEALENGAAYTCRNPVFDDDWNRVPNDHAFSDAQLRRFTRKMVYYDGPELHDSVARKQGRR